MSTYSFTTSPPTNNVPGLTTVFTYATEYRNLWVLPLPESLPYSVCNSFASTSSPDVYYDIFWSYYQPLNYQTYYSPGVCPSGHTVASVTEDQYVWSSSSITI
jgi:hypothetical protein